ncbi:hypothetical protein KOY49_02920 [Candidatus Minimicrobia vallesae]|uniref:Clp ATPase C-terminal domain-containing protein n=1 Tax=Candidatus Minimicrobia vallesae TaxID=2841264 RepID=A0A8F1M937_9BACT|nr:hypothetical protein KOY49_02920 [Candidatus Minimicrobia vallesae]
MILLFRRSVGWIDRGFDEQRGVRVLRRTIQSELADPLERCFIVQ